MQCWAGGEAKTRLYPEFKVRPCGTKRGACTYQGITQIKSAFLSRVFPYLSTHAVNLRVARCGRGGSKQGFYVQRPLRVCAFQALFSHVPVQYAADQCAQSESAAVCRAEARLAAFTRGGHVSFVRCESVLILDESFRFGGGRTELKQATTHTGTGRWRPPVPHYIA